MRKYLGLLAMLWLAAPSAHAVVLSHLATDAELVADAGDIAWAAEGRFGNNNATNGDFELDLHEDNPGVILAQSQHAWTTNQPQRFRLEYTNTGLVKFDVGGREIQYTYDLEDFGSLYIRTRAVNANSSIRVNNLFLDGVSIADESFADAAVDGLDILRLTDAGLMDGFVLTGNVNFIWGSPVPNASRLAFQIKAGGEVPDEPVIPEPATLSLIGLGMATAGIVRRRNLRS